MTQGISGWVPVAVALIAGLVTMVVLKLMQTPNWPEPAVPHNLPVVLPIITVEAPKSPVESPIITVKPPEAHESKVGDRIISPRTPDELVDEVKGKTKIAANSISKRHIGQWLIVSGTIFEIYKLNSSEYTTVHLRKTESQPDMMLGFVSTEWHEVLSAFNVGDTISAMGKIESISNLGYVSLEDCKLR